MDEYKEELINQFRLSIGVNKDDFNFKLYEKEFLSWLSNYKKMGEFYLNWLIKEKIIDDLSYNFAETGKGKYDTVTLNQGTTLITPYINGFENADLKNRIFNYELNVFNGFPSYVGRNPFNIIKNIDVFMTQNPYCMESMINWPQLYNLSDFDIIVGLYGNNYDKDKTSKLTELKRLKERINDDFNIEKVTSNDSYCYVLSTKYTKRKNKSLKKS